MEYFPYLSKKLKVLDVDEALAGGLNSYLLSRPYLNADKWKKAYDNIMSRGLTGVVVENGRNSIKYNGNNFEDLESNPYYGDVSDYIVRTLSGLAPQVEEEPKNLPLFDANVFDNDFGKYLSTKYYAGKPDLASKEWNKLDTPDKYGISKVDERKKKLIEVLTNYRDQLKDDGKYSYEGGPFENVEDVKAKITAAINALNSDDKVQINKALNALGWDYDKWLNTGADRRVTLNDGTQITAEEWRKRELERNTVKSQNQQPNQFKKYRFIGASKMNGTMPNGPDALGELNSYYNLGKLTPELQSKLVGAFRFAEKNGALSSLSPEELKAFGNFNGANRLKKIKGLDGFYWDSTGLRIVQPFMDEEGGIPGFLELVSLNNPKTKEEKKLIANNRKLSEGWEAEDYLRMGAMALDIAGATSAWFGPYGMAVSGGLGLTSLATNLAADINDESLSKLDVAKNAGVNLGLAAVGMVPGLGLASRTGKWISNIARWAPRLLTIQALKDTPEVYNSIKKALNTPNDLTNEDWRNIAYGLSIAAGLSRGAKGFVNNRKFKPTITQQVEKKSFIKTKSGKEIEATKELAKAINKVGNKEGNDAANSELRKIKGAENEEVNYDYSKNNKLEKLRNKGIELTESKKFSGLTPEALKYSLYLKEKNEKVKANHSILSKIFSTDYDIYLGAATLNMPNTGIMGKIKEFYDPVKLFNKKQLQTLSSTINREKLKEQLNLKKEANKSNPREEYRQKILNKSDKEIDLFNKSYGSDGKVSNNSMIGGYGSSSNKVKNGEINVNLGDGTTFSFKINNAKLYKNNPGKIAELRGLAAQQVLRQLMSKQDKIDHAKIREVLLGLKKMGALRQGGTINNIDNLIREFLKDIN